VTPPGHSPIVFSLPEPCPMTAQRTLATFHTDTRDTETQIARADHDSAIIGHSNQRTSCGMSGGPDKYVPPVDVRTVTSVNS
jgi:hypothetical protein